MSEMSKTTSGLTDSEAREFHNLFVSSFVVFTIIAIIAHILVWQWRPWFPGVNGYTQSFLDGVSHVTSYLA